MNIYKDFRNQMGTNSYLIVLDNKDAYIIDAASQLESFQNIIDEHNLNVKAIVLTHGHFDHIDGAEYLRNKYNTKLVAHLYEKEILNNPALNLSSMVGKNIAFDADLYLEEEEGEYEIFKYILTPGHTKGGISLIYDNSVFTGDTLFEGSVGRSDFPTGNHAVLINSIKEKLLVLDKETIVYPGHGEVTKIGIEEKTNPFLL